MIGILAAAALAAATPAPPPAAIAVATATNADPAVFVVHDADTTVYIFGTFHALDSKTEWFNDQVKDAFEKSDELALETLIPEGPPKRGAGLSAPPQPLRMPVATSASVLAATKMTINAGRSQGMQVSNGADMVLRRIAVRRRVTRCRAVCHRAACRTAATTPPAQSTTITTAQAMARRLFIALDYSFKVGSRKANLSPASTPRGTRTLSPLRCPTSTVRSSKCPPRHT